MRELRLIDTISGVLGSAFDASDDVFCEPPGVGVARRLVLTTDLLIEGRHFTLDTASAEDIGWKAAAVNLSDLAASGARPQYLLVALGLPGDLDEAFVHRLYTGLKAMADHVGARIVGGDTVGAEQLTLSVTATGYLAPGNPSGRRGDARPGDVLVTTGPHGLSAAGLHALQTGQPGWDVLKLAHRRPVPRLNEGQALAATGNRFALMDTSDGLADAGLKIAAASGVRVQFDDAALFRHPALLDYAAQTGRDPLEWLLYGGEDFELLGAIENWEAIPAPTRALFTPIGRLIAGPPGAELRRESGAIEPIATERVFDHFAPGGSNPPNPGSEHQ